MKYRILSDTSEKKLEDKVNTFLDDDWLPVGGVSVLFYGTEQGVRYSQSIVKRK
ncbi:DUF1737 domain-containing protein [Aquimarina algiphila]|uniref:DUF1737 domain-containing protein n=1 Tax=Aquimarina algiphila TaxID=2047982 RepID=A0A554VE43_9FLAO|nr:DUF1737 domain-containing protein [Aquimarina algiphila]TSE05236.1 DUF1737 domain-containing protein [Aquimarina algiphila]